MLEVGLHLPPTMSLTTSKVHLTRSKVQLTRSKVHRLRDEVPKAAVEGSKLIHLHRAPPPLPQSLSGLLLTSFHLLQQLHPPPGKTKHLLHFCFSDK